MTQPHKAARHSPLTAGLHAILAPIVSVYRWLNPAAARQAEAMQHLLHQFDDLMARFRNGELPVAAPNPAPQSPQAPGVPRVANARAQRRIYLPRPAPAKVEAIAPGLRRTRASAPYPVPHPCSGVIVDAGIPHFVLNFKTERNHARFRTS